MKKLAKLILMSVLLGAATLSCQKESEIVDTFDKPTDVVNPNPPLPPVDFTKTSLKELAAAQGIKLGAAFTYSEYFQNDSIAKIIARDFAAVTFGNEMKHDGIVQANGKLKFSTADEMVGWTQQAGAELFGHVLGWHSQQQTAYLNSLIDKSSENTASIFQDNWNFEEGTLDGYTVSGAALTQAYTEVFAGEYGLKATGDASVAFTAPTVSGTPYIVSFWARTDVAGAAVALGGASSEVTSEWTKYAVTLKAGSDATAYTLTATEGVCIDNIRVIETVIEEQDKGGNYINPHAIGALDFEEYALGATGSALVSEYGWSQCNGADYVTVTDETANGGSQSLKMDNADGHCGNAWDIQAITPAFDVVAGTTYRIAWYGRANTEADLQIDIREDGSAKAYKNSAWGQYDKTGTDWTYIWLDYTVEAGSALSVAFYGGTAEACYYIDDFQIFEPIYEGDYTNYIDPANLLSNPDFESGDESWGIWNGGSYVELLSRNEPEIGANADYIHSGLHAYKVDNTETGWTGGSSWHIQIANNNKVEVVGGASYRVAMWVKSPDGATTIQVHYSYDNGSTGYKQITGIGEDWTYIYRDDVMPDDVSELQFVIDAAYDAATYYIDDVQFFPTPVESYIELGAIGSDDFESYSDGTTGSDLVSNYGYSQCNGADYVTVTSAEAHSGNLSVKMANADAHCGNAWDIQLITPQYTCEAGTTYRIAWYGKATEECDIQIDIREDGSAKAYKNSAWGQYDKTGTDWTYISIDYTVEEGSAISVAFYGGTSEVDYYLDDFQIFPVEASTSAVKARRGFGKYQTWNRPAPRKVGIRGAFETAAKLDGETAEDAIGYAFKSWVYAMVEHFDVYAWDVVNETFTDQGNFRTAENTSDGFIWGTYYNSTKDWVDKAFAYATDALALNGKEAVLYINDYNLETSEAKRKAFCEYASGNDLVTGVGTQMHLDMATENLEDKIVASLKDLVATGKKVRISELDIKCTDLNAQADLYKFIFQQYIELVPDAQKGGITVWGINDKDSWVGEANAPLLFSGNKFERKPAYEALYVYLCELAGINPYTEEE